MPVYTSSVSNLVSVGPVLDVRIAPSRPAAEAVKTAGGQPAAPISVAAMFDTGASASVLQSGLAKKLKLHPIGTIVVSTPSSHKVVCPQYFVSMIFPTPKYGYNVPLATQTTMIEAPMKGQNIQCLIGRDLMALGVFVYSGPDGSFTFAM